MKYGRKERNDKTVIYNYVSCDLTFVTRDSKSSFKSSDSRMSNSAILIFFLNSGLGNTRSLSFILLHLPLAVFRFSAKLSRFGVSMRGQNYYTLF